MQQDHDSSMHFTPDLHNYLLQKYDNLTRSTSR